MAETLGGRLVITSPDAQEQVYNITLPVIRIGRLPAPQNDLVLDHLWVSRAHARLYCDRRPYRLQDLRSPNGTYVNDNRLPPEEVRPLKDGDVIAIGPFRLRFEAPQPAVSAPPEELPARPVPRPEPPREPPPPPSARQRLIERWVGMPDASSRWLQYLPPIYSDDEFLGRFLLIFEDLFGPVQQAIAHFSLFLDPTTAPESFLPCMNEWLAKIADEYWAPGVQRELLRAASELYQARGTRAGLQHYLEIVCQGYEVEILENVEGPHTFKVILRTQGGAAVDRHTVERIIEVSRPAHTSYTLEIR